jgi:hypothetical protein
MMVGLLLDRIVLLGVIVMVGELRLIVTLTPMVCGVLVQRRVCNSTLRCHFNSQYGLFISH